VGAGLIRHTIDGGLDWEDQHDGIQAGDVNVVATKPGTLNPEEIYIICGHYDSISQIPETYAPGADDNGTGAVGVIEAARILKDYDFEATLRFVCFSREEQGLVGSNAYVKEAYGRGDSIVGALNFDMIGYEDVDPEDVEIICNTASVWLGDEYETAAGLYVPSLGIHRQISSYVGSDNTSFWNYGYSSFCGIEDSPLHNPYYHRTTDRVSTLDFDFYTDVVRGAVATLAELARVDTVTSAIAGTLEPHGLKISPNPGNVVTIGMAARGPTPADFEIYDVNGRLVARVRPSVDSGLARAVWNGTDSSGDRVGSGIYFLRPAGSNTAAKIILLK
jgi:Zn-dependent M28 family amino/carboxypeptidase